MLKNINVFQTSLNTIISEEDVAVLIWVLHWPLTKQSSRRRRGIMCGFQWDACGFNIQVIREALYASFKWSSSCFHELVNILQSVKLLCYFWIFGWIINSQNEQHINIKFCICVHKSATEMIKMLRATYRFQCISTIYKWHSAFSKT